MQREKKFRGWFEDIGMQPITDIETSCILMQYTGLKDRNGVEIYEGDIIGDSKKTKLWEVKCKNLGELYCERELDKDNLEIAMFSSSESERCTVYGNIYEHPHLLDN